MDNVNERNNRRNNIDDNAADDDNGGNDDAGHERIFGTKENQTKEK